MGYAMESSYYLSGDEKGGKVLIRAQAVGLRLWPVSKWKNGTAFA